MEQSGRIRIIAGKWRSRQIRFPQHPALRPTSNRIRETVFNWLQHRIEAAYCLDLFSGTGIFGLESLSRGAASVLMVERDRQLADNIIVQAETLGARGCEVVCGDSLSWLRQRVTTPSEMYDIVFIDPPFADNLESDTCQLLESSGVLKNDALIYLESVKDRKMDQLPPGWRILKSKSAGSVQYLLLQKIESGSEP